MVSTQLYNKTNLSNGYIDEHGVLKDSPNWVTTDFFEITKDMTLQYSGISEQSGYVYISYYTKGQEFTHRLKYPYTEREIQYIEGSSYIRFSLYKDDNKSAFLRYNWDLPFADNAFVNDPECSYNAATKTIKVDTSKKELNRYSIPLSNLRITTLPGSDGWINYDTLSDALCKSFLTNTDKVYFSMKIKSTLPITVRVSVEGTTPTGARPAISTSIDVTEDYQDITIAYSSDDFLEQFGQPLDYGYSGGSGQSITLGFSKPEQDVVVSIKDFKVSYGTYDIPNIDISSTEYLTPQNPEDPLKLDGSTIVSNKYNLIYVYRANPKDLVSIVHHFEATLFTTPTFPEEGDIITDTMSSESYSVAFVNVPNNNYFIGCFNKLNIDYTRLTPYFARILTPIDDSNTFSLEQLTETYATFRDDIYNWMKTTLSENLTQGDLDIIIRLMCYIFGDLTGEAYALRDQIDPDKAEEYYLRHLSKLIGYEWNEALTADQQRESIKLYIDIRRRRGTKWSLENLIRVFGQDVTSFYSSSDIRGVTVNEYDPTTGTPNTGPDADGLFPGDILIEVPQFSTILREAIDNIRLIGTRIIFAYLIYIGPFNITPSLDCGNQLELYFDPAVWGYDPIIKAWGPRNEATVIATMEDFPLSHVVRSSQHLTHCIIYTQKTIPFEKGFIWSEPENTNYKGYLIDDKTLKDTNTMYQ